MVDATFIYILKNIIGRYGFFAFGTQGDIDEVVTN
jgi:hypothetical protein